MQCAFVGRYVESEWADSAVVIESNLVFVSVLVAKVSPRNGFVSFGDYCGYGTTSQVSTFRTHEQGTPIVRQVGILFQKQAFNRFQSFFRGLFCTQNRHRVVTFP